MTLLSLQRLIYATAGVGSWVVYFGKCHFTTPIQGVILGCLAVCCYIIPLLKGEGLKNIPLITPGPDRG